MLKKYFSWSKKERFSRRTVLLIVIGLIILILMIIGFSFFGVIKKEISYLFMDKNQSVVISNANTENVKKDAPSSESINSRKVIIPADNNFSIIIPKIDVNTKIIKNVDPLNSDEYLSKLKDGVVHSKTSGLPNDKVPTFIFAHSSNSFYDDGDYNSIFYLLYKLKRGDVFYLVYNKRVYRYVVQDLKKVDKHRTDYLRSDKRDSSVILMTCWPPGTDKERLLVFGKLVSVD